MNAGRRSLIAGLIPFVLTIGIACNDDGGPPPVAPSASPPATPTVEFRTPGPPPGPPPGAPANPPTVPVPPVPTRDTSTAVPPALEVADAGLGASGAIQGLYTYPSEGIPAQLRACALNLASRQAVCTEVHLTLTDHRGARGEGYRLVLPPGEYHAYAELPGSGLRQAYYNDFVLCGFHVTCPSHAKITLAVKAGVLIDGVLLGDWYEMP